MDCTTGSIDALWTTADGTAIPMHFLGPSEVLVSGNPNVLKERGFEGATLLVGRFFFQRVSFIILIAFVRQKFAFVPNDVAFFDDI